MEIEQSSIMRANLYWLGKDCNSTKRIAPTLSKRHAHPHLFGDELLELLEGEVAGHVHADHPWFQQVLGQGSRGQDLVVAVGQPHHLAAQSRWLWHEEQHECPGSLQGSPSHSVEPGPKPTTLPASDVWCPCCTGSLALAQWNQDRSMETYVPTYRTKVRRFGGTRGGWLCGPPCHSQPCVLQPTGPCSTCSTAWCTCPEEGMDPSALRGPPSGSGNFQSHPDSSSSSKSTSSEAGVERWKADPSSTAGNSHHAPAKSQVVDWKVTSAQTPSDPSQCRHQSSTVEPLRSCLIQCWGFRARAAARGQSMALDTGVVWGGIVSGCSHFFLSHVLEASMANIDSFSSWPACSQVWQLRKIEVQSCFSIKKWRTFLEHELATLSPHEFPMLLIETCYTSHHDLHMSSCCHFFHSIPCLPRDSPLLPLACHWALCSLT